MSWKFFTGILVLMSSVAHADPALRSSPADKKEPVFIRSEQMQLDSTKRVFIYDENVEITRGDLFITADHVTGKYDANSEIDQIECERNVVITRGDTMRATSNRAHYDVKSGVVVLTEGPELNDRGNVLVADKVTLYTNEDRSEAEGHVRVKVLKSETGIGEAPKKGDVKREGGAKKGAGK